MLGWGWRYLVVAGNKVEWRTDALTISRPVFLYPAKVWYSGAGHPHTAESFNREPGRESVGKRNRRK
jgi:mannose-6-phosphate isomerase-like protein (cupin superfamily)